MLRPALVACLLGAALALAPELARAEQPVKPTVALSEDDDPSLGAHRSPAPDQRSGHFLVTARGTVLAPFGQIASGSGAGTILGVGTGFGGALGYGLSRSGVLELTGAFASFAASPSCGGCSGNTLDLGLGVTYHLTQSLAFDPWGSYGLAYRRSRLTTTDTGTAGGTVFSDTYQGLDFLRLGLGGDFYPTSFFGFGPFLELDLGTYVDRPTSILQSTIFSTYPPTLAAGPSVYGLFQFGVRLTFDPIRGVELSKKRSASR